MVLVWALLHYPATDPSGKYWPEVIAEAKPEDRGLLTAEWKSSTILAKISQGLEPVWTPIGWDWRIGAAALASFPAREVVVASMGIVFGQDPGVEEGEEADKSLGERLREAKRQNGSLLFTVPTALSLLVFVALCCQCVSTLAVMAKETRSWKWPAFTFVYMTGLAYLGAFLVYQIGTFLQGGGMP
jgi:ferrous iron transport protein B